MLTRSRPHVRCFFHPNRPRRRAANKVSVRHASCWAQFRPSESGIPFPSFRGPPQKTKTEIPTARPNSLVSCLDSQLGSFTGSTKPSFHSETE